MSGEHSLKLEWWLLSSVLQIQYNSKKLCFLFAFSLFVQLIQS